MNDLCTQQLDAIDSWFDLSTEERAPLVLHAESCEVCRARLEAQSQLEGMISEARAEYLSLEPRVTAAQLESAVARPQTFTEPASLRQLQKSSLGRIALAAAAAALLWMGVNAIPSRQAPNPPRVAASPGPQDSTSPAASHSADWVPTDRRDAGAAAAAVAPSEEGALPPEGDPSSNAASSERQLAQTAVQTSARVSPSRLPLSSSPVSRAVRGAAERRSSGALASSSTAPRPRVPQRPRSFNFRMPSKPQPDRTDPVSTGRSFGAGEER